MSTTTTPVQQLSWAQEIAALVLQLGPLAIDLIVKMEGLLNIGPDEKANIANAIAAANKADQATIDAVAKWMAANGFKTIVSFVPATPASEHKDQLPPQALVSGFGPSPFYGRGLAHLLKVEHTPEGPKMVPDPETSAKVDAIARKVTGHQMPDDWLEIG